MFRLLDQVGNPAAVAARSRAGLPPLPRTGWLEVLGSPDWSSVYLGVESMKAAGRKRRSDRHRRLHVTMTSVAGTVTTPIFRSRP